MKRMMVCSACLLAGTAMAQTYAPEFTGDIPSVIISDRTGDTSGDVYDAPNGGWNGTERPLSAFLFRFDDVIDASTIVDVKDAGSLSDVKVLFTEYSDETDLTPNTEKTISINGKIAVDDVPIDTEDFTGSAAFDLSDSYLDFRNIDFSPSGDGPFDPVGESGDDITSSGSQSRVVTLHLGSDNFTQRGSGSDNSFMVYTTLEGADRTEYYQAPPPPPLFSFGGRTEGTLMVFLSIQIL